MLTSAGEPGALLPASPAQRVCAPHSALSLTQHVWSFLASNINRAAAGCDFSCDGVLFQHWDGYRSLILLFLDFLLDVIIWVQILYNGP